MNDIIYNQKMHKVSEEIKGITNIENSNQLNNNMIEKVITKMCEVLKPDD